MRPAPTRPAMPSTSPRCSVKRCADPARARRPRGSPRRGGAATAGYRSSTRAAHHQAHDLVARRVAAWRRSPALRPSRSTTKRSATCLHLLEEVRDVDDRVALRLEPADQLEQASTSSRPRLLVGSSSTSTRQPTAERARDLDELLLARRQACRPARRAGSRWWPSSAQRRRAAIVAHRAAIERRRTARAPCRARCSP